MPDAYQDLHTREFQPRRVVDGDTLFAFIDLGFRTWAHDVEFRLARVNTPERGQPGYADAAEFTRKWLLTHLGHSVDRPHLLCTTEKTDNWKRWIAEVTCAEGHNLSDDLLTEGHAIPYVRATRKGTS